MSFTSRGCRRCVVSTSLGLQDPEARISDRGAGREYKMLPRTATFRQAAHAAAQT